MEPIFEHEIQSQMSAHEQLSRLDSFWSDDEVDEPVVLKKEEPQLPKFDYSRDPALESAYGPTYGQGNRTAEGPDGGLATWRALPSGLKIVAMLLAVASVFLAGMTIQWLTSGGSAGTGLTGGSPANLATSDTSGVLNTQAANGDGANVIMVDVHGDVMHPGVYQLPATARMDDAIKAAGGFIHAGDRNLVNEAEPLTDGQEIIIGDADSTGNNGNNQSTVGATVGTTSTSGNAGLANVSDSTQIAQKVDINTADAATLQTIPGIGPRRAAEIIQYRTLHGPFRVLQDLRKIRGIGKVTLARLAPYLYFST